MYMWQSRAEIEHYSIVYFDYITMIKTLQCSIPVKGGAKMDRGYTCYVTHEYLTHLHSAYKFHP